MPQPFLDPDETGTAVVDRLVLDHNLFLAERARIAAIDFFLRTLKGWKDTAEQGQGKPGFRLDPPPMPPAGYNFVDVPPVDTAPKPLPPGVHVGPRNDNGTYLDQGDQASPKGTVIDNPYTPGAKLVKVVREYGFGKSHYWIDYVAGKGNK